MEEVTGNRLSDDEFYDIRGNVLAQWDTSDQVADLDASVAYQLSLPSSRRASNALVANRENNLPPLIMPRFGAALEDEQATSMRKCAAAGAGMVTIQTDPYTRQLQFGQASTALRESIEAGRSLVSGYPVLAQPLETTRRITACVDVPVAARQASSDGRLTKEFYLSAGATYFIMGAVQNLAYEKDATVERLVKNYQYEHRLFGEYTRRGAPITLELTSIQTGTLVPPAVTLSTTVLDGMLAAEQGVKNMVACHGLCGSLVQDVAAIRAAPELLRDRLDAAGHHDVNLYTVVHQFMGPFPIDETVALTLIGYCAMITALAGADVVINKTTHEALGVPTWESNVVGVKATHVMQQLVGGQRLTSPQVEEEKLIIHREVNSIVNRVLELGDGDVAKGLVAAVPAGVIDIPFSPSKHNAGRVLTGRDHDGAVRYIDTGNVPFPSDIKKFHADKMGSRLAEYEGTISDMLVDDVFSLSSQLERFMGAAS
jgi:methylaspartate mutase epsilon subunit